MTPPLSDYERDPVLKDLIIRATGALAMLSIGRDENPELRLGLAKSLRRAMERATGKSFHQFDFSDLADEAKEGALSLFELFDADSALSKPE